MTPYDATVLADHPVMYLPMTPAAVTETDAAGHQHNGTYHGPHTTATTLPDGQSAPDFNGIDDYLQIPDADVLSPETTGTLTIEAWMRPDTLQFTHQEGSGDVYWAGKRTPGQQDYVLRKYSQTNTEDRPNRVSGYLCNRSGGLGVGGYFQGPVSTTQWMLTSVVITCPGTSLCPDGSIAIYKNGVLRQSTALTQSYATISAAGPGGAPLRIATRDSGSFFAGASRRWQRSTPPSPKAASSLTTGRCAPAQPRHSDAANPVQTASQSTRPSPGQWSKPKP